MKKKETRPIKSAKAVKSRVKPPAKKSKASRSKATQDPFQRAIESASIVSMANKRGDITYVNDNFVSISGYARAELLGQNHRIINSGHHPKAFWVDMWKTISSGKTWRAEVKNKAKDGSYYWVDTFVMPFLDEEGNVREFLSIRNDITQRKTQEERIIHLNHSLADFQQAIQGSSIVSMADRKGIISYVNDNFVAISGYAREELIGQNHRIINSGHHAKEFWIEMWREIGAGRTWRREVKNKAKDGTYYWVDTFVMPFLDERGNVREFLSIRNDITSRKQMEEDLLTANDRLRETLLFSHVGTAELDVQTHQLRVSEELANLLEMSDPKPFELLIEDFVYKYIAEEDRLSIFEAVSQGQQLEGLSQKRITIEFDLVTERGNIRNIEASGMFRSDGKAFGILQDVTVRKTLEREREQSRVESISKGRQIERILYSITDGFFAMDRTLRLTLVNPVFALQAKMEVADMVGRKITEIWPGIEETPLVKKYVQAMQDGEPFSMELENDVEPGQYFQINGYPNLEGLFVYYRDISDEVEARKQVASKALQMSEVIDSLQDGFLIISMEWVILEVNQKAADIIGTTCDELIGATLWDRFPALPAEVISRLRAAIEKGEKQTLRVPSKSHPGRVYEISMLPAQSGLIVLMEDVTESIQFKKKLEEEERKLSGLVNNLPDAAIYQFINNSNGSGHYGFISESILRLTGFGVPELMENPTVLDDRIHPDDRPLHHRKVTEAIGERKPLHSQFRQRHRNDEYRWLEVRSFPREEAEGVLVFDGIIMDITDRVKTEQLLIDRELKNSLIIKHSGEGILFTNANGRIFSANPAACVLFQMTEDEIMQAGRDGLVDMDDPTLPAKLREREERGFFKGELRFRRKDGTYFTAEVSSSIFFGPTGEKHASMIMRDITDRKAIEQMREELLLQFERISTHVPGFIYLYRVRRDGTSHFPYASNGIAKVYGVQPHEVREDAGVAFQRVHSEDLDRLKESILSSAQTLTEWREEYRVLLPDGQLIWVEGHASPQAMDDGSVSWYGYISDITTRKKTETEFKRLSETLDQSRQQMQTIMDHAPMVVFMKDADGRYQFFNHAYREAIPNTDIGCTDYDLFDRAFADECRDRDREVLLGKTIEFEHQVVVHGRMNTFLETKFPIRDSNGNVYAVGGVSMNISEYRTLQDSIKRSEERLRTLANNIPQGIIYQYKVDKDGAIVEFPYVSEGAERVYGFPASDIMADASKAFSLVDPADIPMMMQKGEESRLQGTYFDCQYRINRPDGRQIWVHTHAKPARQPDGSTIWDGLSTDITDLKLAQEQLLKSQTDLKAILNASTDVTFFIRSDFTIQISNVAGKKFIENFFGSIPPDGDDFRRFVPASMQVDFLNNFERALRGEVVELEREVNFNAKVRIWAHIRYLPVRNELGQIIGVSFNGTDVTERKKAEELFRKKDGQLRFATMMANMGDWELDLGSMKPFWSNEVCRIHEVPIGYQPDLANAIEFYAPESRTVISQAVQRCIETGETYDLELEIITAKGNRRFVRTIGISERKDGKTIKLYGLFQDITQQKTLQKELERLALIVRNTDNLVIMTDADRRIVWVNESFENLTEYRLEEVKGRKPSEFLQGPETDPTINERVRKLLENRQSARFEVVNYSKSGRKYWLDIEIQPLFDEQGTLINFIALELDITERKHADEQIRKKEEQIRLLTNNLPDNAVIFQRVLNLDGTLRSSYFSSGIEALVGVKVEEAEQNPEYLLPYVVEEERSVMRMRVLATHLQEEFMDFEVRINHPQAGLRSLHFHLRPIKLNDGGCIWNGIISDITERKLSEELLKKNEEQLRFVTDNLPDHAVIYQRVLNRDYSLRSSYFSSGIEALLGIKKQEAEKDLNYLIPFVKAESRELLVKTLHAARDKHEVMDFEVQVKTASGKMKWIRIHSRPFDLHDGATIWNGMLTDITERKEAEERLRFTSFTIDHTQDIILWIKKDGSLINTNPAAVKQLGLSENDLRKSYVHDFDLLYRREVWSSHWAELREKGSMTFESQYRRKDGSIFFVEINANLVEYKGEEFNIAIVRDMTERKKLESEMRESEQRIQSIARNLPNGSIYQFLMKTDGSTSIPFISEGIDKLVGLSSEVLAKDASGVFAILHPEDASSFQAAIIESASSLSDFHHTVRVRDSSGKYRWLAAHSKPRRLVDGSILWDGIILDETERNETHHEFVKSQLRLQAIFDNAINAIILADDNGNYVDGNLAACYMLGYTHSELIKLNVGQVILPHTLKMDPYNQFLRDGQQSGVIDLLTKTGKIITTRYNAVANILPGLHLSILEDITERKQIEKAMAENERRFKSISQNLPNGSIYQFAWNPNGEMRMQYFSDGLAYRLGTTGQAIMDDIGAFNSRCHPDDALLIQAAVEESARNLSDFRQRVGRFADNSGNYHHLSWYSHPTRLEDGTVIWDGVVMDETEQYEKEMALIESEERFRGLVNEINIGILLQGPNAEMLLSNQAALDLLGVTEDQLLGRSSFSPDWNVIHEDGSDFPGSEHPVPVAIRTGKPVRDVVMGVYNPIKRQRLWLQVDAIPRLTKDGNVKNVICTFNDISKLKRSEVQLKESAERLVLATRAASIGVWEWNLVTNDLIWDTNMYMISGFEENSLMTYSIFRNGIHPDDIDFVEENARKAIEEGSEFNTLFRYINNKDKSVHYFQGFGTVQRDELGKPLRMIGVDYDVTEQIENEQRLQESEERLLKSLHEKEILIKEIHHRIKNNLQLISSMIFIRMGKMEHGEIRSFLEETRQKIRSIAIIHERLLQSGDINVVDIADYLGKLILDLQMTYYSQEVAVQIETDIEALDLPLDIAINCGLILNELLTNSFKHAFVGKNQGLVYVNLKREKERILFTIGDNGNGLPEVVKPGSGGFGMLMLDVFFKQLGASVQVTRAGGTQYTLSFRIIEGKSS